MAEALEPGGSTPTEQTASTPATQDKPTTKTSDPLMDALGIPKDVQSQIIDTESARETPTQEATPADQPPETPTETPPSEPETKAPVEARKDEPDDEDDEDDEFPKGQDDQPQKPDKRQKRINRLTRKLHERDEQLDALTGQLSELQKQLGKGAPAGDTAPAIPSVSGRLSYITDERQLSQEIARSNAVIDWCSKNAGVTLDEKQLPDDIKADYAEGNLTLQEASAKTISQWKDECQNLLLNAPTRREEIRTYGSEKQFYDGIAQQAWPEIFDKKSSEYQLANAIAEEFPTIKSSSQRNYAIGLVIEGMKSLKGRVGKLQSNGSTNGHRARDISPRAFEPRVPIAPSTPEPPTRETGAVSSQNEVKDAMSALIKDPDGSAQSLAAVLAAEEKAQRRSGAAGSRTPVTV